MLFRGNYIYFFNLFPIKTDKIVFVSFYGKGYGENGKAIIEELLKQKNKLDIVWLMDKKYISQSELPVGVRAVPYNSILGLYELATAKIWVDNARKIFYPPKKKSQIYIQTWHASLGLKLVEKDVENNLSKDYVRNAVKDSKMCDLMISGSDYHEKVIKRSFWYDGKIAQTGTPKCDVFFKDVPSIKNKVREIYNVSTNELIILYAPTFRNNNLESIKFDFQELVDKLNDDTKKYKLLIRLHPNVSQESLNFEYSENVLNATDYDDIQELLYSSDILITDYSSSMFDMLIAKKKCILYTPDLKEYLKEDRPLSFSFDELPFPVVNNHLDLPDIIASFNEDDYIEKLDKFWADLGIYEDGNASLKLATIISNYIYN